MGAFELIRAVAVVGPAAGLLVIGFIISMNSGGARLGTEAGLRRLGANLSRSLLVFGTCLLGLAAIQQLVGFRLEILG